MIADVSSGSGYWCNYVDCLVDLNVGCPEDLQVLDGDKVVACKSSCLEYGTDEACCLGEFDDLELYKNSTSAEYFKRDCPKAYSYPYVDGKSTFSCYNVNYDVVFG
jgi:hypothetical protein